MSVEKYCIYLRIRHRQEDISKNNLRESVQIGRNILGQALKGGHFKTPVSFKEMYISNC